MATAQINARIDTTTKAAGDRALSAIGCTPTRAIRALWGFAARNRGNEGALRSALQQLEGRVVDNREDAERVRRVRLAEEGPANLAAMLAGMGLDPRSLGADASEEELRMRAFAEKYRERGLHL